MKILVTGGLGYVGSHTVLEIIKKGHQVVIIDNCFNSKEKNHKILENYSRKKIEFYKSDILNKENLDSIFKKHEINSVIHFAGLKSVSESALNPVQYYNNNFFGSLQLIESMEKNNVKNIIFSSSATVYGNTEKIPILEDEKTNPLNVYGKTKLAVEELLRDYSSSKSDFSAICLRYFNPIGAHPENIIGEDSIKEPTNLLPSIIKVAKKEIPILEVFGGDFDTADGTCIRDYIHVVDLALGHIKALDFIKEKNGFHVINLGSGNGTSVLELIKTFEDISGIKINFSIVDKRIGDAPISVACTNLAKELLNWECKYDISKMCEHAWNFHLRSVSNESINS